MRILPLVCSILLSAATLSHSSPGPALVLDGITVIDVQSGRAEPGLSVVVEGEHITGVGKRPALQTPAGARVVDASGKFLIPGLWDMHVHTAFGDWFQGAREIALPLFIANGVTGVRDMGGDLDVLLRWRKEIAQGSLVGPRMVVAGPMLDGPKPRFPSSVAVTTPEDGRRAVRDLARRGVDFIKLQSLIPRDAVFAIAEEAKKAGLPFAGHVPDAVRASEMSRAGQKSFEHLIGIFEGSSTRETEFLKGEKSPGRFLQSYDEARAAALVALLARNHTWQCPTLVWEQGGNLMEERDLAHDPLAKYAPASWRDGTWKRFTEQVTGEFNVDDLATRRRFVAKELDVVAALHRAGVPFLAGTDTVAGVYIFPGFSLHDELGLLVKAGFTPLEALRTATVLPAAYLSMSDRLGRVQEGNLADLVLLDANPLDDIANTRRIHAVLANGRYFSRADLDALLHGVEERANRPPTPRAPAAEP
jgi:imidazolonepropionase-like amidohydrolase